MTIHPKNNERGTGIVGLPTAPQVVVLAAGQRFDCAGRHAGIEIHVPGTRASVHVNNQVVRVDHLYSIMTCAMGVVVNDGPGAIKIIFA